VERPVSGSAKTALFRIVQEALTNVVKHAIAENARIYLTYETESVTVKIIDDGQGFEPRSNQPGQRISWGLKNMEERASLLGGNLQVKSHPGAGTSVEASIPYAAMEIEVTDEDPPVSGG
jgi:signal transduction histidine kinase